MAQLRVQSGSQTALGACARGKGLAMWPLWNRYFMSPPQTPAQCQPLLLWAWAWGTQALTASSLVHRLLWGQPSPLCPFPSILHGVWRPQGSRTDQALLVCTPTLL